MKAVFVTKTLQKAISKLNGVVADENVSSYQRITIGITEAFGGSKATLTGLSTGFSIREEVDVECSGSQSFSISYERFSDIVKVLKNEKCTLEIKDTALFVSSGRSRFSIQLYRDEGLPFIWPSIPFVEVETNDILVAFKRGLKAGNKTNQESPQKTVMHIAPDKIVTSDGIILSLTDNNVFQTQEEFNLSIVHAWKIIKIISEFSGSKGRYAFSDGRLFLAIGSSCLSVQGMSVSYYPFRMALEKNANPAVTFLMPKRDLMGTLSEVLATTGDGDKVATITFTKTGLHFTSKCDISSTETFVDCVVPIDHDLKMYVDAQVLCRALESMSSEDVTIGLISEFKPIRLTEDGYVCFIQPRRIQ